MRAQAKQRYWATQELVHSIHNCGACGQQVHLGNHLAGLMLFRSCTAASDTLCVADGPAVAYADTTGHGDGQDEHQKAQTKQQQEQYHKLHYS